MVIIPQPKSLVLTNYVFRLNNNTKIVLLNSLTSTELNHAILLKDEISKVTKLDVTITKSFSEIENSIILNIDSKIDEAYNLTISNNSITIIGQDSIGLLYGIQTLRQIINQSGYILPGCKIIDKPSLTNRGFYHDITRGRVPTLKTLKELVDKLSYYKINQLQLYIEHTYLFSNFSEVTRYGDPLTSEEILLLDQYCLQNGVELVPSLSTFGHLYHALSSKSFEELCELENSFNQPFSFIDRMAHHTLNVANPKSIEFVKTMLNEFIPLFSSNKFNICCDETFDIGKGKSKELKEKIGEGQMYVDFVNQIVKHVKSFNKEVMMWGDIISNHEDKIASLDQDITCLTWSYSPEIPANVIKLIHDHNLKQYVCSGTNAWNMFLSPYYNAYLNIKGMAITGKEYGVIGLLNTNWGDFGNVNTLASSLPCLIYGAEFAWNCKEVNYEEINERISYLEYHDKSKQLMSILDQLSKTQVINWWVAVGYIEKDITSSKWVKERVKEFFDTIQISDIQTAIAANKQIIDALYAHMNQLNHESLSDLMLMAQGILLFNQIGLVIKNELYCKEKVKVDIDKYQLATTLESWYTDYQKSWRKDSKESELFRIGNIIFKYADLLRTI
jgi:hypothetical protein